ncbi:uncharacterized protein EV154DRAFT_448216 [Mucor mucedo]|uniref:uncharacterized protein n=1 Tax=Mucor mucedo TaxID=29922 RepID=UPI00221FF611|nr:uncharacterized protein EV154DRAFT_448216 [Mucor mucedo]KAI7888229.1 hypothetical protein EV154DRAFT_448216 [Mucor mucedo]
MRGCSIMVEIIKKHSQYNEIRFSPIYLQLKQRTNEEIFALLEELAIKIENWYRMRQEQYYTNNTHFNIIPVSPATTSAAAYAYRPSHDPRNFPHYSLNDLPTHQPPPSPSSSLAQAVSTKLSITTSDTNQYQLPSWTNYIFPNTLLVEPHELVKWITVKENQPSILLIDNRPRELFRRGCIKHLWIIQIEPVLWQKDDMAMKMQESIQRNPEAEQRLFAEKARFDLIVYYDQNSKSLDTAHGSTTNIRKILETQHLKRPPMMLAGGFDAWHSYVGASGVYTFLEQKEKKQWFKSGNSSTSSIGTDHEPHTLYDSFSGKPNRQSYNQQQQQKVSPAHSYPSISIPQPSLPTAPRKESLTTRYPELLSPTSEVATSPQRQPVAQISHQQQDLRPMPPSYPKIHRRKTFIDNPFNGFTNTMSKLYDVPPMSIPHSKASSVVTNNSQPQRPSSAEPSVSINRPYAMSDFHHVSTNNIHSSPTSSSYSQSGTVIAIGTTGLKNMGNTCYMNSIIQCLSGTIPLARYFISGLFKQHINRNNKTGTQGVLTESFVELLRAMWSESYTFVSPMTFREALVRFAPRFSGFDQQDSQEFLLFLLDGLHEDLNSTALGSHSSLVDDMTFEKLPDWQASALSWEKYLHRNSSVIVSLFQGQYRSRLTCLSCKQTSTTYNVFMSLSLPIPAKKLRISSVTLYQCLDYFVKEETLDKEDAWKCPQCKKKRKALKQLTLTRLPDILLIHLKRFSMDGLFKNKLDIIVKCPTRSLDLSGYVPMTVTPSPPQDRPSYVYDLYAVSNHYGSLSGGHYTACVRDGYTDKWHYFDDSKFSLCDENKVVTKAAYNLFYVRSKVK